MGKRISSLCQLPPVTLTYWVRLNCYLIEKQNYVLPFSFFSFAAAHFHLVSISSFSHRRFKTFQFFFQRKRSLFCCCCCCCCLISRSNSFSVIHVNVGIKIEVERLLLLLLLLFLFLSQKVREAMRFTAETHGCFKGKISSGLTWMGGRTYGRFSQNTNFLDS